MFTGLIEDVGVVETVQGTSAGLELGIRSSYRGLDEGESIAVNGACLTVRETDAGVFTVAAVGPTLERTAIGDWNRGRRVNLERAMRADGRLGGHLVQGHVDGVGTVVTVTPTRDAVVMDIDLPAGLGDSLVPLGSVAVDGVSLTVNAITGRRLQVSLIEYTLRHSALGDLLAGSRVHVETDIIGKYVRRLLAPYIDS
jgi:riboflavin synthase